MIHALGPKWVVRLLTTAIIVLLAASIWAQQFAAPNAPESDAITKFWTATRPALLGLNLLFLLMTWWRALWLVHWITRAKYWWFPWVGGEWRGEVKSNWPRVEAMMKAAASVDGSRFDALKDNPPLAAPVKVKARIRCSLFSIKIHFDMVGTQRTSDTIFVRPHQKAGEVERPTLFYMYRQDDGAQPAVTDQRRHLGAATLALVDEDTLRGPYWNARNEERGLNTAGILTLERVKKRKTANKKPKAKP